MGIIKMENGQVPRIPRKEAERVVKKHKFEIKEDGVIYTKKDQKKADKFEEKHGFRYEDAWNLDHAMAVFVLPRLVQLRDTAHGYPTYFIDNGGYEAWLKTLDEIIYGFYLYVAKDLVFWDDEDKKVWFRAKALFCKFWESLWD